MPTQLSYFWYTHCIEILFFGHWIIIVQKIIYRKFDQTASQVTHSSNFIHRTHRFNLMKNLPNSMNYRLNLVNNSTNLFNYWLKNFEEYVLDYCRIIIIRWLFSIQNSKSKNFSWVCLRQNYLPKFVYGTWPYSHYDDFFGFQSERVNTWSSGPASWRTWTTSAGPSGLRTTP